MFIFPSTVGPLGFAQHLPFLVVSTSLSPSSRHHQDRMMLPKAPKGQVLIKTFSMVARCAYPKSFWYQWKSTHKMLDIFIKDLQSYRNSMSQYGILHQLHYAHWICPHCIYIYIDSICPISSRKRIALSKEGLMIQKQPSKAPLKFRSVAVLTCITLSVMRRIIKKVDSWSKDRPRPPPPTPFSVFQSWVSNFASTVSACFAPLDPRVIHQHIPSSDPTWVGKYLLKYHEISITNELSIAPQKVKIVIYFHWLSHVFRQKVHCSWFSPGVSRCIPPFFHGKSTVFPAILPWFPASRAAQRSKDRPAPRPRASLATASCRTQSDRPRKRKTRKPMTLSCGIIWVYRHRK